MSGVFFSSHTNSTKFTECCETAICDDQSACPGCGREVPYTPGERHSMAMQKLYGWKEYLAMCVRNERLAWEDRRRERASGARSPEDSDG